MTARSLCAIALRSMPVEVTVKPGDSLSAIAKRHGVQSWGSIYYADENAGFRALRSNPNRIMPGDKVWVPDGPAKAPAAAPGTPAQKATAVHKASNKKATSAGKPASVPSHDKTRAVTPTGVPIRITPHEVANGSAVLPDEFLAFVGKVLGARRFEFNAAPEHLGEYLDGKYVAGGKSGADKLKRTKDVAKAVGVVKFTLTGADALEGFCTLYEAWRLWEEGGQPRQALSKTIKGLGKMWGVVPPTVRQPAVGFIAGLLGRVDKLRPAARLVRELDYIGALPDFLSLLASVLELNPSDAANDIKALANHLSRNKHVATRIAPTLVELFIGWVPNHKKAMLLARCGGRKVPVLGTIVVGAIDLVDATVESFQLAFQDAPKAGAANENTNEYLVGAKWAGVFSSISGLFPGAGTVGSIVLDAISIALVAIGELERLHFDVPPL